jgi:hypothetical protein
MASAQTITAQLDNSTNIEEEESFDSSNSTVNTTFIAISNRIYINRLALRKKKIRMVIAQFILFVVSAHLYSSMNSRV